METEVTLNTKAQKRVFVLNGVLEGRLTVPEASEMLGISVRHTRRILARYRENGVAACVLRRFEALQPPLSSSCGLMRVLSPIVQIFTSSMLDIRQ